MSKFRLPNASTQTVISVHPNAEFDIFTSDATSSQTRHYRPPTIPVCQEHSLTTTPIRSTTQNIFQLSPGLSPIFTPSRIREGGDDGRNHKEVHGQNAIYHRGIERNTGSASKIRGISIEDWKRANLNNSNHLHDTSKISVSLFSDTPTRHQNIRQRNHDADDDEFLIQDISMLSLPGTPISIIGSACLSQEAVGGMSSVEKYDQTLEDQKIVADKGEKLNGLFTDASFSPRKKLTELMPLSSSSSSRYKDNVHPIDYVHPIGFFPKHISEQRPVSHSAVPISLPTAISREFPQYAAAKFNYTPSDSMQFIHFQSLLHRSSPVAITGRRAVPLPFQYVGDYGSSNFRSSPSFSISQVHRYNPSTESRFSSKFWKDRFTKRDLGLMLENQC